MKSKAERHTNEHTNRLYNVFKTFLDCVDKIGFLKTGKYIQLSAHNI